MGQGTPGEMGKQGDANDQKPGDGGDKKFKPSARVDRKQRKQKGAEVVHASPMLRRSPRLQVPPPPPQARAGQDYLFMQSCMSSSPVASRQAGASLSLEEIIDEWVG